MIKLGKILSVILVRKWVLIMNQEELRKHRCCFTGHRPQKLNYTGEEISVLLEKAIDKAIESGYVTFITGMAMGVDIWAAEIVLQKRKSNTDIHLICAIPHPEFEKRRNEIEQNRFHKILCYADLVREINHCYFSDCYQLRNEWMVNRSSLVIAAFDGRRGGTKNTINYAQKRGIEVWNILKYV